MDAERWNRISELYEQSRTRPASERAAFLAAACADDPVLQREVQALLDQPTSPPQLEGVTSSLVMRAMPDAPDPPLSGRRFGDYLVGNRIDSGGMGVVYRARDTRLGRDVAIKVLRQPFADDPERVARFEREARLLAALDHPHIGAIHGLEEHDGTRALVLALVDGETLADRIARGPGLRHGGGGQAIPIPEALAYARQIAEALEAAHEKGIVHRDLKPSNIRITPAGIVKVLDFGLATMAAPAIAVAAIPLSDPAGGLTRDGVILGTAAYMSPEQARGGPVDRRTDVWAFGCVLYEMLTGQMAFRGETVSDTIAAVLERDVDWRALPEATPASVHRLLQRCLVKNPARRLRDIGDARLDLDEGLTAPEARRTDNVDQPEGRAGIATGRAPWLRSRWRAGAAWIAAATAGVAAAALAIGLLRSGPIDTPAYRTEVVLPAGFERSGSPGRFALSPDGRRLAFAARDEAGAQLLWVRDFDEVVARPLAGTDGAEHPFWSPDSQSIAFFANQKLKHVAASGGAILTICDAGRFAQGGTWNRDDVILFTFGGGPLFRVAAGGGTPEQVTTLDMAAAETGHAFPFFLPDGRHFLYTGYTGRRVADRGPFVGAVYVGALDSTSRTQVLDSITNAEYANGHLFFVRDAALAAQPLDLSRMRTTGPPLVVADRVHISVATAQLGAFSAAGAGVVVFEPPGSPEGSQLEWIDRQGRRIGTVGSRGNNGQRIQLSPDGTQVLISHSTPDAPSDVVLLDLSRSIDRRLTSTPSADGGPVWSPDGGRVAFARRSNGPNMLFITPASGQGPEEPLLTAGFPDSWSPDGRFLLYTAESDLWMMPLSGERKPFRWMATPAVEWDAQFSPNGQWVAYSSSESGRFEIYVAPFSDLSDRAEGTYRQRWPVSMATAHAPRWRRDGKELFFWSADEDKLMAVEVDASGARFSAGRPRPLFDARPLVERYPFTFYDVSPDGQRFLVNSIGAPSGPPSLALIVNWPALPRE